jgi:predicted metal-dependent phosphoesterase TrpH
MSLDLHLHSHFSDGNWSPTELVEHAVSIKLKHIAITDHDTINGIPEARLAAGNRIEIIPGVEINTLWQLDNGQWKDIHILGYFIDHANAKLLRLLEKQRAQREIHTLQCIEKLSLGGIAITMEHIQQYSGKGAVGKLHLAQAIIAAGGAADATEAFDKYLLRGSKYYVERKSVTAYEAIEVINAAGGVASIAHPGNDQHIFDLILKLKSMGLRAIEAHHRAHSRKRVREFTRFARSNKMLVTGGSDCHGPYKEYKSTMGTVPVPLRLLVDLRNAAS